MTDFNPLGILPADLTPSQKAKAKKLGKAAARSYKAAVEMKCMDCVAWYRPEAKNCLITTCPLWAANRKIFKGPTENIIEKGN